jgi:membrane protein required for colicin V production
MIDFVLGLVLAAMLVRGWLRGFIREALDLVGLVAGLWLAFRLSAPVGDFLTDSFGVGPEAGRIGGGILLFVLFGALLSVAAHYLSKVMKLPGLSLVNRVGGAGLAVGWGVVIVLILVSLIEVLPISSEWRDDIEESNVVQLIAGEDAFPRQFLESLAGDNVMTAIASLRELFGSSRAVPVGKEALMIPPAPGEEIRQVRSEADRIIELVNEDRVSVGARAVRSVGALTELAEAHAEALYTNGRLRRMQNCRARLIDSSYQVVHCDNGVALAGTAVGAYEGIYETPEGQSVIEARDFDRAGIAVVEGPTGRLVVVVLAS